MVLTSEFKSYTGAMYNFDEIQMKNFKIITRIFNMIINDKIKVANDKLKAEIGNKKLMEIGLPLAQKFEK